MDADRDHPRTASQAVGPDGALAARVDLGLPGPFLERVAGVAEAEGLSEGEVLDQAARVGARLFDALMDFPEDQLPESIEVDPDGEFDLVHLLDLSRMLTLIDEDAPSDESDHQRVRDQVLAAVVQPGFAVLWG